MKAVARSASARALVAAAALCLALALAPGAHAADDSVGAVTLQQQTPGKLPPRDPLTPRIYPPESQDVPPPVFSTSARQAVAASARTQAVQEARRDHPGLEGVAYVSTLKVPTGDFSHWDVIWYDGDKEVVEVQVSTRGEVLKISRDVDIGWPLLYGMPGVIGKKLNSPWIWLPLCALFLLPFVDPKRPKRLLHLDLAVLLGFGLSHFFFNRGEPDVSVPLVYPFLLYVVARAAWAGFRPAQRSGPLMPHVTTRFLEVGVIALVALRIAFGAFGSESFDIGIASSIGADRVVHGLPLYTDNDVHGDTYGPVNYLLYVPAEAVFPFTNEDTQSAPAAASILFDIAITLGLLLLGRSLRSGTQGRRLGAGLAWAWAAFPYSALLLAADTNDALVPLFVIYALIALRSPFGRGLMIGLATLTKFVPAALAPLILVGRGPFRWRAVAIAAAAYLFVVAGLILLFMPEGGLRAFWNTTIGFQLGRTSPLSIWTREPSLEWLKPAFLALAGGLVLLSAFRPRRRSVGQVAALCAAILAAAQVPGSYWLYFYVAWWAPFYITGLFEEYRDLGPRQDSVTSDFVNPVRISQPSADTATRSSMRTPSLPGR